PYKQSIAQTNGSGSSSSPLAPRAGYFHPLAISLASTDSLAHLPGVAATPPAHPAPPHRADSKNPHDDVPASPAAPPAPTTPASSHTSAANSSDWQSASAPFPT